MSFWGELRRLNVCKVGAAYVIIAWLIIQAVVTIFPVLQLPEWAVTLVTVLPIIGFPLALLFAWAFEITPDGIKLKKEVQEIANELGVDHILEGSVRKAGNALRITVQLV